MGLFTFEIRSTTIGRGRRGGARVPRVPWENGDAARAASPLGVIQLDLQPANQPKGLKGSVTPGIAPG